MRQLVLSENISIRTLLEKVTMYSTYFVVLARKMYPFILPWIDPSQAQEEEFSPSLFAAQP